MAREKLIDAKKAVVQGKSPAHEKQREKRCLTAAKTFGDVTGSGIGTPCEEQTCAKDQLES